MPNFSNPRGTLLAAERREALVQLARQHGFWVVEDDPYGELRFDEPGDVPQAMPGTVRAAGERLAAGGSNPVVYLSSLSKTVAPALRVGWMLADAPLLRRCTVAKQTADLCTSPLTQSVAACYLASGRCQLPYSARQEYQRRMQALVQGLNAAPDSGIRCSRPAERHVRLGRAGPPHRAQKLFDAAVAQGVVYVPGKAFYPADPDLHTLRMSFAAPEVPQIAQAVERLCQAAAQSR